MGITISNKNHICDLGYDGFRKFRIVVAKNVSEKIGNHYKDLEKALFMLDQKSRDIFFKNYDNKTNELIKDEELTDEIANFLYKSDCEGNINKEEAKQVFELIKNEDDNTKFGYVGRPDCAKMADLKKIFSDGEVEWY